jgi:hypothetical protein
MTEGTGGSPDPFTLLRLERTPWLDPDLLNRSYDEACREAAANGQHDTSALHAARQDLATPSRRLALLFHIEGWERLRISAIDPALMDLFQQLSPLMAEAAETSRKLDNAKTELAKALLFPEARRLQNELARHREALSTLLEELEEQLRSLSTGDWKTSRDTLAALQNKAGFLEKWHDQARQKWMALVSM